MFGLIPGYGFDGRMVCFNKALFQQIGDVGAAGVYVYQAIGADGIGRVWRLDVG
jgi:hypothetical protein